MVVLALGLDDSDRACSKAFDRARWLRPTGSSDRVERYELAEHVVDCQLLAGGPKAKVRRLLGPPLRHGGPKRVPPRTWTYDAGFHESLSGPGDDAFLWVYFTRSGRVRKAEVAP